MTTPPLAIERIDARRADRAAVLRAIRARLHPPGSVVSEESRRRTADVFGEPLTPEQVVERICADVRRRGLEAVLEYSARLDRAALTGATLRVPAADLAAAHAGVDPGFLATVRRVRERIRTFQSALLPRDAEVRLAQGGWLRQRYQPLRRVGICVPGGAAAYPSTLLMTAVPAQAAGVAELVVIAPPTPLGAYNRELLALCQELGVTEVYRLGGAQGVAALAYGVEGLEAVEKIVGPGNLFVALAKRLVYGQVDIDAIAGPSEVVVLADASTSPEHAAADLIAQAEHSPGASVLISWSAALLEETHQALARRLAAAPRGELARQSLESFGALVLVADAAAAAELADALAPEHLHIATADAAAWGPRAPRAGAVFLGAFSPVAVGDYVAGPSHVLPTGGTARFASGLSALSFLRSQSEICFTRGDLAEAAADLRTLAECEGLAAHRASVDARLEL